MQRRLHILSQRNEEMIGTPEKDLFAEYSELCCILLSMWYLPPAERLHSYQQQLIASKVDNSLLRICLTVTVDSILNEAIR